jgi:hypothetical protein
VFLHLLPIGIRAAEGLAIAFEALDSDTDSASSQLGR